MVTRRKGTKERIIVKVTNYNLDISIHNENWYILFFIDLVKLQYLIMSKLPTLIENVKNKKEITNTLLDMENVTKRFIL